ncbi:MAG TPA: MIP family channel protein [Conexibacter sp.]|jgi:MIP family channel proteins|nr:MIP family channel protein [Conexibacter sp.]
MSSVEFVVIEEPEPRGVPAYYAELVGTFLLVFFICSFISVASAGGFDLAGLALAHAFILAVLIYTLGGTSGAHFNPAVTFALWSIKKISTPNAVVYVICQCIGGILGALVVLLLFKDVGDAVNYGATAINGEVLNNGSVWLGLLAEAIGTFLLMYAIMGLAVNPRGEAALAGLGIGLALGVAVIVFGPATGAGLNPARWLGPAVASGRFDDFWIYIVGPLVGALAAALAYRTFILDPRWLPAQRPKDELPG